MNSTLFKSILCESGALTKGSQRVLADKNMVANLADAVREDSRSHPAAFPAGFSRTAQKSPDEALAQWFLENIDRIEKEGYENTVYSRDGVNSDWIVRRYIAGSHNWEDLTGVMNMNLRDWYLLKNRNMLDTNHKDLPKFNGVREVGRYMTTHYSDKLASLRDAAKNAARNKMSKKVLLVDNDDYRIYTVLNRAAACQLGLGTQWCTANSNYPGHFNTYSDRAMLFQLFPYVKDTEGNVSKSEEGKKLPNATDKYQFDAGGPTFMNVTDTPVPAAKVRETFPYIYSDLSHALKTNKGKMEEAFKELSIDPTMQDADFKIKTYEIEDEIKKLHKFVDRGYMTDESRPSKSVSNDNTEQPAGNVQQPAEQPAQQPQGQITMENNKDVDSGVTEWINRFAAYDALKASKAPVMEKKKGVKEAGDQLPPPPDEVNIDLDEDTESVDDWKKRTGKSAEKIPAEDDPKGNKFGSKHIGSASGQGNKSQQRGTGAKISDQKNPIQKPEVNEGVDPEVLEWMGRFAKLGNMKGYGR